MTQSNSAWGEATTSSRTRNEMALVADHAAIGGAGGEGFDLDGVFIIDEDPEQAFGAAMQKQMSSGASGDQRGRALGLIKGADALSCQSKLEEAAQQVAEAIEICNELKFEEGRAAAMNVQTKIQMKRGEPTSDKDELSLALESGQDTLKTFQKLDYRKGEAVAEHTIACVYHSMKQADKSIGHAKLALQGFSELGESSCAAEMYMTLCNGFLLKGECAKAAVLVKRAAGIYEQLGNKSKQANCMHTVAQVELCGNDVTKAFAAMEEAIQLYREAGDFKGAGEVMSTKEDVLMLQKKYVQALAVAKNKMTMFHEVGETRGEAKALIKLGDLYMKTNEFERAGHVAEIAMGMCAGMNDFEGMAAGKELMDNSKHAKMVEDIECVIESQRDMVHVPQNLIIDAGLNRRVMDKFREACSK